MKSQFEVDRKFFLEIIDDLAKAAVQGERNKEATPEDWARWEQEARENGFVIPAEPRKIEETEEVTEEVAADRYRQTIARTDLRGLLFRRRYVAKAICRRVARVGNSHTTPCAQALKELLERLQVVDAEIRRRIPGGGPVPPDQSTPEDLIQDS